MPLLRKKKTLILFPMRSSAAPMGSFNLAFERSQGQLESRCYFVFGSAFESVYSIRANEHRCGPRFQSSATIFRNRPPRPSTFTTLFFPRTKRFPFFSKEKKKRHPELRGPDPDKSEAWRWRHCTPSSPRPIIPSKQLNLSLGGAG